MMPAMNIISRLIAICLFRAGPDDLPVKSGVLQRSLLAYLLVGVAINVLDTSWVLSLSVSVADTLILLGFTWVLLRFYHHLPRLNQTLLALNTLLLILMVVMLWSLMVTAHIIRRALETSAPVSVAWTVLYVIISIVGSGLVMSGIA